MACMIIDLPCRRYLETRSIDGVLAGRGIGLAPLASTSPVYALPQKRRERDSDISRPPIDVPVQGHLPTSPFLQGYPLTITTSSP